MAGRSGLLFALGLWAAGGAGVAHADFSACDAALRAPDPARQIDLYTLCLTKGGLMASDRAGAYNNRGSAHMRLGEEDRALADFNASIANDPNWNTAYMNRARIYLSRDELDKAKADLDQAVHVSPSRNWSEALLLRARVNLARRDAAAARADVDEALHKAVVPPEVYGSAAMMLAVSPDPAFRDPAKAVELGREAVRRRNDAQSHDALAFALAASGQFEDAVAEETRAIDLAHRQGGDASAMGLRLEAYQKRQGPAG